MERLERIAEHVCGATGYDPEALRRRSRDVFLVTARQVFCYYARGAGYPLGRIGAFIGVHHSTVLYSANRIDLIKDCDRIVRDYINKYEIMSKRKQVIEITPPPDDVESEIDLPTCMSGFVCPTCSGKGITGDSGKCTRCCGSGHLRAFVSICWGADWESAESGINRNSAVLSGMF